jgi:two-component system cell cycle sensor histidine kinase/response regulator CckA
MNFANESVISKGFWRQAARITTKPKLERCLLRATGNRTIRKEKQNEIMISPFYRILLIEDDPSTAQSIWDMLKDSQDCTFQMVCAKSLQTGLPKLASEIDVLLLDIPAPDCSGLAHVSEIDSQFNSLPIIVVISQERETIGKRALNAGAAEYLVKETLSRELLQRALRYAIERKRAESATRQCEERFHDLFENAKDILFTLDLEGRITSLNKSAEEVMGWSKNEALQKNIKSLVAPEHFGLCNQMMRRIVNEEPLQHFEISVLRKDGRRAVLETSARLIRSNGKKEGVQGTARDVTERRQLENMVRQSQKLEAIGRLSGGVAHDFNNLLCVISGHAEMLSERLGPANTAITNVTQIKKAADSAASLTRQLLAFSRKQVFHPQTLDLNVIVVETEKLLGRLIGEHIKFFTELDPALENVRVDPVQIEQVLVNLVLNARDAMPRGGKLTIETSNVDLEDQHESKRSLIPAGSYVMFAVTDTGCGMDEETQSRIFEPFYTTKELGKGTGLGLATVYGIVKQSGGFIWVYSEPGRGTTFKVYLPRVENPATPPGPSKRQMEACKGTETVLLVEDAGPLRALITEFLQDSGYAVLETENGNDAMRIASKFAGPIHLLLTDVVMPGMGGQQLADQLTRIRPEAKVLYMSGYPNDGIVHSGILAAGVVLLEKPFTREILLRRVRQVLDEAPHAN